jgi:hypothetical protein
MVMNLFEQIKRIKVIMFEQVEDYEIMTFGDMNSELGMRVCIKKPNGEHIGKTNIIDYENYSCFILSFLLKCKCRSVFSKNQLILKKCKT